MPLCKQYLQDSSFSPLIGREAIVSDSSCDHYFFWFPQLLGKQHTPSPMQGACCSSGYSSTVAQEGLRCTFLRGHAQQALAVSGLSAVRTHSTGMGYPLSASTWLSNHAKELCSPKAVTSSRAFTGSRRQEHPGAAGSKVPAFSSFAGIRQCQQAPLGRQHAQQQPPHAGC